MFGKTNYISYASKTYTLRVNDPQRTELTFDIINSEGEINIHIYNKTKDRVIDIYNPESGRYHIHLRAFCKYKITIKTRHHVGGYRFYL